MPTATKRKPSKTKAGYEAINPKAMGGSVSCNPTHEEIMAAIQGCLEKRKAKGETDQDQLTRMRTDMRVTGRPAGTSTGLPINLAICYMFQQNERADRRHKLTDIKLAEWLRAEFPKRPTERFDDIQMLRRGYNVGRLTRSIPPVASSHRYDSGGTMIDTKYKYRK